MKIKIDRWILVLIGVFYFTRQIETYLILMAFVLLHELGHMVVGLCFRLKVSYFEIMPFGFSIRFQKQNDRKEGRAKGNIKKAIVAFAGPAVNLLCAILLIYSNIEKVEFIYANLWIAIFNLLPIYPLDGGRIVEAILDIKLGYQKKIEYIERITTLTIVLLTGLGSVVIVYYQNILIFLGILCLWFIVIRQKINFMRESY